MARKSTRSIDRMAKRARKYTLDTNLFIGSFRDDAENAAIQRFHRVLGPFEYLSSVVVQELRAGVVSPRAGRSLERHVLQPFRRRERIFTPSATAWEQAGDILAVLRNTDGIDLKRRRTSRLDLISRSNPANHLSNPGPPLRPSGSSNVMLYFR